MLPQANLFAGRREGILEGSWVKSGWFKREFFSACLVVKKQFLGGCPKVGQKNCFAPTQITPLPFGKKGKTFN
jgi:hypothetical protein